MEMVMGERQDRAHVEGGMELFGWSYAGLEADVEDLTRVLHAKMLEDAGLEAPLAGQRGHGESGG
jgi:hypothetical protein